MSLEAVRRENIKRNRKLLDLLDIATISTSLEQERDRKRPEGPVKKQKKIERAPTRRSRRLAGLVDDGTSVAKHDEEINKREKELEELRSFRNSRLEGDYTWEELSATMPLGDFKHEREIYDKSRGQKISPSSELSKFSNQIILEYLSVVCSEAEQKPSNVENLQPSSRGRQTKYKSRPANTHTTFTCNHSSEFKLTPHRISAMHIHPADRRRIVIAGDTNGNLGIWAVDASSNEGQVAHLMKPHGRNVSGITHGHQDISKLYSVSYDGSCRGFDLTKQSCFEIAALYDALDEVSPITDMNQDDKSSLFMSTMNGLLYRQDLRMRKLNLLPKNALQLHEKKIGGFSLSPTDVTKLASVSLDRTMKIWDLRKIATSIYDDEGLLKSPTLQGVFDLKLSISTVDWNKTDVLVCNGYDNKIRLFDARKLSRPRSKSRTIADFRSIDHNCQTGRWLSILKARWQTDPHDGVEKFVIGNMNRSIDVYSAQGDKIFNVSSSHFSAVPAVVSIHPTQNWIAGGSASGKVTFLT